MGGSSVLDRLAILDCFEHRADGDWICLRDVRLTTRRASIDIRRGSRFAYGSRLAGIDLAEYLERLGAQCGS